MAMRMLMFGAVALGLLVAQARGEPYWITYEGDAMPEDAGWQRHWGDEQGPHHGGAERWIEDGVFVLDSLRHDQIFDFYDVQRLINAGPGEIFIAQWRMRVDELSDFGDAEVVIARDAPAGHVAFEFGAEAVFSVTDDVWFPIEPDVFHTYRFVSADMVEFEFYIDDILVQESVFEDSTLLESFVGFGDGVQGRRSLSYWDYFRFGAVPEPTTMTLSVCGALLVMSRSREQRGHSTFSIAHPAGRGNERKSGVGRVVRPDIPAWRSAGSDAPLYRTRTEPCNEDGHTGVAAEKGRT